MHTFANHWTLATTQGSEIVRATQAQMKQAERDYIAFCREKKVPLRAQLFSYGPLQVVYLAQFMERFRI